MIYFLLYLFLEVVISTQMATLLGGVLTFVEILLSAVVGIAILANFRNTVVENLRAVSYNAIDLQQFQQLNLFTLIGAIMLIIPGFLTDFIGLLMQFSVVTSMFVNRFSSKLDSQNPYQNQTHHLKEDNDVIDVEIISDSTRER